MILADDPLGQFFLEAQHRIDFIGQHPAHRDPGPVGDHPGHDGRVDAEGHHGRLALKEISPRNILRILAKEFHVGLVLSLMLGLIAFGRVIFFGEASTMPNDYSLVTIAAAISFALGLQVIS